MQGFDESLKICEKLVKEEVIRFWELSGSPSGSSGSLNSLKEDNSKSFGRILMKFSGTRKESLDFGCDPNHCLDLLDPGIF